MNFGKNYINLIRDLEQMPENIKLERIRHLGVSIEIFQGNYRELIHHLKIHNTPKVSLQLMGQDKRDLLHAYQIEITRFLHNYIASSLSLIDHTRNHYRELYGDNGLFPEYKDQIEKRFVTHPLSVFIKDLRQYIQHFKMPALSSRVVYTRDAPDLEMTIRVSIKDLDKFSGWKSKSKEYLMTLNDDIDLMKLVQDYHNHIDNFYTWFINRQMEIHKEDIRIINVHKKKIRDNEMMRVLFELIQKPKSMADFESDLYRLYPEEELKEIKETHSKADRIQSILKLLSQEEMFDSKAKAAIKKMCENNR